MSAKRRPEPTGRCYICRECIGSVYHWDGDRASHPACTPTELEHMTAERNSLASRVKELQAEANLMREVACWLFDEGHLSDMHDEKCPQDDTCECEPVSKARVILNDAGVEGSAHAVLAARTDEGPA